MLGAIERVVEWVNWQNEDMTLLWDADYEVSYIINRKQLKIDQVPEYEDIFRYVTDIKEIVYINPDIEYAIEESIENESCGGVFEDAYQIYKDKGWNM